MCWNKITSQKDIDNLINEYCGFHDAIVCSVNYVSGASVDNNGTMYFTKIDNSLIMTLESQMVKKRLELKFIGMRNINLKGYMQYYTNDIFECYLSFYKTTYSDNLIVWADNVGFNPDKVVDRKILDEPAVSFVVSNSLEWRFSELEFSNNLSEEADRQTIIR